MARRTGLPEHIRAELPFRAKAGHGLDFDYPTEVDGTVVPAATACTQPPSKAMWTLVHEVTGYLQKAGAMHIDVVPDRRSLGQPGNLTVCWFGEVSAAKVAETFAVSTTEEGTPRVPAWLCLRRDDDFDLRWQPPY